MISTPILGIPLTATTQEIIVQDILQKACDKTQTHTYATCTVYTLMRAQEDPFIAHALTRADYALADGMPLVWLQRQSFPQAARIYGPDVLLNVCRASQETSLRHYFWGSTPSVTTCLIERLKEHFPELTIAGWYCPPVEAISQNAQLTTIEKCQQIDADIIWVGLGSPKQDVWMHLYKDYISAGVLVGVGAAFDFVAGTKPQAPRWMQRRGLEWFFRLLCEPRRLWRRYIIYNARFIARLLRL